VLSYLCVLIFDPKPYFCDRREFQVQIEVDPKNENFGAVRTKNGWSRACTYTNPNWLQRSPALAQQIQNLHKCEPAQTNSDQVSWHEVCSCHLGLDLAPSTEPSTTPAPKCYLESMCPMTVGPPLLHPPTAIPPLWCRYQERQRMFTHDMVCD